MSSHIAVNATIVIDLPAFRLLCSSTLGVTRYFPSLETSFTVSDATDHFLKTTLGPREGVALGRG